ncbi:ferredoxin [Candidatus Uhrbacteria bacterium]|nr:ferredoxin [Candidatus Uhrbacteria bacterium]
MKIVVDRDLCIGAASCVALAAKTFGLDVEGKAYILNEKKDTAVTSSEGTVVESEQTGDMDPREAIIEGARSCPVFAIKLYEDDGTEIIL